MCATSRSAPSHMTGAQNTRRLQVTSSEKQRDGNHCDSHAVRPLRCRDEHVIGICAGFPHSERQTWGGSDSKGCFFGDFLCTSTAPQERREQRSWPRRGGGQDARSQESYPLAEGQ